MGALVTDSQESVPVLLALTLLTANSLSPNLLLSLLKLRTPYSPSIKIFPLKLLLNYCISLSIFQVSLISWPLPVWVTFWDWPCFFFLFFLFGWPSQYSYVSLLSQLLSRQFLLSLAASHSFSLLSDQFTCTRRCAVKSTIFHSFLSQYPDSYSLHSSLLFSSSILFTIEWDHFHWASSRNHLTFQFDPLNYSFRKKYLLLH